LATHQSALTQGDDDPAQESLGQRRRADSHGDGSATIAIVLGTGVAVGVAIGVWLGIGAIVSSLAGDSPEEPATYWRDLVYGSSVLGSTFLLTKRGISSIPQRLEQVELPGMMSGGFSFFLLILQLLIGLFFAPVGMP